ncbi:MAG TPA: delta-60 repeat domain-containing protein, partial [Flavobacteriales bacterium]|nr:delta-60 repeat domain-containing protein [Flavobacteriales bacterium]
MRSERVRWMQVATNALLVTSSFAQMPFSLDTTFRTEIMQQYVNSILALPDGKVIASGVMRFPGGFSDKTLVRLLADGTQDPSFYNSGLGGGGLKPWQSDRFYVAGTYTPRRIWATSGDNDGSFAVGSGSIPYFSPLQGGDYN